MSDERPKKSWSEIDHARIRGQSSSKKSSQRQEFENRRATSDAKKKLDDLFAKGKLTQDKVQWLEKIKAQRGKPEFYKLLSEYYELYGCPRELEPIQLLLDHKDKNILLRLLEELKSVSPKLSIADQKTLNQKLNILELTTFDSDVVALIRTLKATLISLI